MAIPSPHFCMSTIGYSYAAADLWRQEIYLHFSTFYSWSTLFIYVIIMFLLVFSLHQSQHYLPRLVFGLHIFINMFVYINTCMPLVSANIFYAFLAVRYLKIVIYKQKFSGKSLQRGLCPLNKYFLIKEFFILVIRWTFKKSDVTGSKLQTQWCTCVWK